MSARRLFLLAFLVLQAYLARAQPVPPAPLGPARWQWARAFGRPFTEYIGPTPRITAMVSDSAARRVYVGFQSSPYIPWQLDEWRAGSVAGSNFEMDSVWSGVACFSESGRMEWVYPLSGDTTIRNPQGPQGLWRHSEISSLALDALSGTVLVTASNFNPGARLQDTSYQHRPGMGLRQVRPYRKGLPARGNFVMGLSAQNGAMRWIRQADSAAGTTWYMSQPGPAGSFFVAGYTSQAQASFGGEPGLAGAPAGWLDHNGTGPARCPVILRVDARSGRVLQSRSLASNEIYQLRLLPFGQAAGQGVCLLAEFRGRLASSPGDTVEGLPVLVFLDSTLSTSARLHLVQPWPYIWAIGPASGGGIRAYLDTRVGSIATTATGDTIDLFPRPASAVRGECWLEVPASGPADSRVRWVKDYDGRFSYKINALLPAAMGGWIMGGYRASLYDTVFGQTSVAFNRAMPVVAHDSLGNRLWVLVADTVNLNPFHLAWGSGGRLWVGGQVGIEGFDPAFRLYRGMIWPHQLYYTGIQNFLGLSEPLPALEPLAARQQVGQASSRLQARPNPASSTVHVQGQPGKLVMLCSVQGRLLQTFQLDGQGRATVNLSGLPPGLYLLHSEGQVVRVVKE